MAMSRKEAGPATADRTELWTAQQVADRLSMSVRTVWRLVAAKQLPAPKKFNRKLVRWLRQQVEDWINAQAT